MVKGVNKKYVSRTFNLSPELVERLDKYSEETGISKTFIIEKALKEYLNKAESNIDSEGK